jgi:hypothetical protein
MRSQEKTRSTESNCHSELFKQHWIARKKVKRGYEGYARSVFVASVDAAFLAHGGSVVYQLE